MSQKTAKKTRQLYRRTVRKTAQELGKELGKEIGNAMKPRPKWISEKIWMWMLGFFIKLK